MKTEEKIENPPAFPVSDTVANDTRYPPLNEGMTLRDYFAAKAMNGMLSYYTSPDTNWYDSISKESYQIADAMLKARNPSQS